MVHEDTKGNMSYYYAISAKDSKDRAEIDELAWQWHQVWCLSHYEIATAKAEQTVSISKSGPVL